MGFIHQSGESKIADFHLVIIKEDVLGFEVTMEDSLAVDVVQTICQFVDNFLEKLGFRI